VTIQLVALDVDGTLVDTDMVVSPRLRQAIKAAQDAGVVFTLATGRGPRSIEPFVQDLGFLAPQICYQGGLIYDVEQAQVLHRATLPPALVHEAIAWAQRAQADISIYIDGQIYLETLHHPRAFYDRWFGLPIHQVPDLTAVVTHDPEKVLFTAEPPAADAIHHALTQHFGDRAQVLRTHELFVELVPNGTSKGEALAWLAGEYRIDRQQVMAVGDSENDLSMVAWAGLGVAMGNAVPDVKAVADWIAPSVQEDGAAVALERFVLRTGQDGASHGTAE
jgi:hypothetical protein